MRGGGRVARAVGEEDAVGRRPYSSGLSSSSIDADDGSTRVSIPRSASIRGVLALIPRSSAATRARVVPVAATVYGAPVLTAPARSAPAIPGLSSTAARIEVGSASASPENRPARIEPASRRRRVIARVSTPARPTTPWRASSSPRSAVERQLDGRRAGSRTT